jgi:competence protein ComGC
MNQNQIENSSEQKDEFPWMEVIVSLVIITVLLVLAWT